MGIGLPFSAKMTLKDRYGFGGFSGTPPSEPNLSTPPPPPPGLRGFEEQLERLRLEYLYIGTLATANHLFQIPVGLRISVTMRSYSEKVNKQVFVVIHQYFFKKSMNHSVKSVALHHHQINIPVNRR